MSSAPVFPGPSELPDRMECYAHPNQLTSVHCWRCGRPICRECTVAAPDGGSSPVTAGGPAVSSAVTPAVSSAVTPAVSSAVTPAVSSAVTAGGAAVTAGGVAGASPSGGPRCSACAAEQGQAAPGHRWEPIVAVLRRFTLTPVVTALTLADVAVFVATSLRPALQGDLAQMPAEIAHGQTYRLLTAVFVHAGAAHLVFNLAALLIVGPPLEAALGRGRFLALYLLAGVGGFGLSFLLGPVDGLSVGASGAIFGICGAWFSLARARRSDTAAIGLLLILLLAYSFYDSSIDWRAHVGGLATGLAAGTVFAWAAHRRNRLRWELGAASTVVLLLVVVVLVRSAQIRA